MDKIITDNLDRIAALCEEHGVRQLDVFGSAARDDFDAESSDLDLLVAFLNNGEGTRLARRFFAFEAALSNILPIRVDLHSIYEPAGQSRVWEMIQRDRKTIYAAERVAAAS